MSKPTKTEAELIVMARAELDVHADCPDGIRIAVLRNEDSSEFRAEADEATQAKPRLSRMRRDDRADRRPPEQAVRCEGVRGAAYFRHWEEPTGPASGGPDDKLRDEAIQTSSFRDGALAQTSDEQLHIGESLDSGFEPGSSSERLSLITVWRNRNREL